jgi:hypothetical protein
MKKGDVVVILEGWHSLLGIARVDDDSHQYDKGLSKKENLNRFFDHVRQVKWEVKYEYGRHPKLPVLIRGFNNALSRVEKGTKWWLMLTKISW